MKRFGWTGVPLKRARISWAIALVALSAALSYPDPPGRRDNGSCPHGCGVCRGSFEECPCEPGKVHDFKNKTCVPNLCQPPDKCQAAAQPAIDRLRQQADAARKKIHDDWDAAKTRHRLCEIEAAVPHKKCLANYKPDDDKCRADRRAKVGPFCDQFQGAQKYCQSRAPASQWNQYWQIKKLVYTWWGNVSREDCEHALKKRYSLGPGASLSDCQSSFATSSPMNSGTFGSSLYRAPGNYCDDQRDAACPTGCDAELRDMNLFDHQRMQSDQDLKGLKNLRFECLPDGQCPNMAETKKAFKDLGEYLCGKKDRDAEFSCVGEACVFVGCK